MPNLVSGFEMRTDEFGQPKWATGRQTMAASVGVDCSLLENPDFFNNSVDPSYTISSVQEYLANVDRYFGEEALDKTVFPKGLTQGVNDMYSSVKNLITQRTVLYLDPAGSDAYDGATMERPVRTLHRAIEVLNSTCSGSCVIHVAAGSYTESDFSILNKNIIFYLDGDAIFTVPTFPFVQSNITYELNEFKLTFVATRGITLDNTRFIFNNGDLEFRSSTIALNAKYSSNIIFNKCSINDRSSSMPSFKGVFSSIYLIGSTVEYTGPSSDSTCIDGSTSNIYIVDSTVKGYKKGAVGSDCTHIHYNSFTTITANVRFILDTNSGSYITFGDTAWYSDALTNYLQVRRVNNTVEFITVRELAITSTASVTIGTLPTWARPAMNRYFRYGNIKITVKTSGDVSISGSPDTLEVGSLSTIFFVED